MCFGLEFAVVDCLVGGVGGWIGFGFGLRFALGFSDVVDLPYC